MKSNALLRWSWRAFACFMVMLASCIGENTTDIEDPRADVSTGELEFPESTQELSFSLMNRGGGKLQWTVIDAPEWLTLIPAWGELDAGESVVVVATVARAGLQPGTMSGTVELNVSSNDEPISIPVSMVVPAAGILLVSDTAFNFGYFDSGAEVTISNVGSATMTWSSTITSSFLELDPSSGSVESGDSASVHIQIVRDSLESGSYLGSVQIVTLDDQAATIEIGFVHFAQELWLIDDAILDAEYDSASDRIIAVSASPPTLHALDPESRTVSTVALNLPPRCVSVRPDGNSAAVGHNGFVSYVDLTSMQVADVYNVTTDVGDIVLASNGWLYAFPAADQWETIRCVNLATGEESPHTGLQIYAGTVARLHPSGKYIYGADQGLSPSDAEKYDIQGGVAAYLYDSPYHGDFKFGGNLWLSNDGTKMFAASGNVFHLSEVQEDDMLYAGAIEGSDPVISFAQAEPSGRVLAITGGNHLKAPEPELLVYSDDFFVAQDPVALPPFLPTPQGEEQYDVRAYGQFVFVNSSGTRYYVIAKTHESVPEQAWGILARDVPSAP